MVLQMSGNNKMFSFSPQKISFLRMNLAEEKKLVNVIRMSTGKKFIIFWILCCIVTIFMFRKFFTEINENKKGHLVGVSSSKSENNNLCLKRYFENNIDKLEYNINMLHTSSGCLSLSKKFSSMYEIDVLNAAQKLNPEFSEKMKTWLGNSSTLLKSAEFQTVFIIHDILLQRTTVYNPLRSKRPVSKLQNSLLFLKNVSESSKINCDFCKPFNLTAEDVFGRIQGKYSVSASNAFKLAKWHGLFIPFEHSIFNIDNLIFLDIFNTSLKWFKKVHSLDQKAKYPVFFWDMFSHAGASQLHVHAHGILGEMHYPGEFRDVLQAVRLFQQINNSHYWDALIEIHETLGLALRFGKTVIISPLVPRREHELWLLSDEPSSEYFSLLFAVIQMYQDKMERYCFSMAGALPVLGNKLSDPEQSLPCVVFIGTRGDCSSSVSDVSSLELYLFNNVNTDPYKTIDTFSEYLEHFSSVYNINEEMEKLWNISSSNNE